MIVPGVFADVGFLLLAFFTLTAAQIPLLMGEVCV